MNESGLSPVLIRDVSSADAGFRDAFGRLRTSSTFTLFDSKLMVSDYPTLFWDDQQISGAGTASTYSQNDARVRLSVSAATAGTRARQTFRRFTYQPAKSQLVLMTFNMQGGVPGVVKRVGLFDANNGLFLQLEGATTSFVVRKAGVDRVFPQSQWNVDKMAGQGRSRVQLDFTKTQIFQFDFEWLGVGRVRFGFVVDGQIVVAHVVDHANIADSVYLSTPNLPLRYEISNGGSGAAAALDCICSSISSEGGVEDNGAERAVDRGIDGLITLNNTALYPVLGIRLRSTHQMFSVRPLAFDVQCISTAVYRYAVLLNPTLAGTAPTWTPVLNSAVEVSRPTSATTVSIENVLLASGYNAQTTQNSPGSSSEIKGFLSLGSSLAGVSDTLWICVQRITGTTETFLASARWRENA